MKVQLITAFLILFSLILTAANVPLSTEDLETEDLRTEELVQLDLPENPDFCSEIGYYNRGCVRRCDSFCPGHLCTKSGPCIYVNCRNWKNKPGCICEEDSSCYFKHNAPSELSITEDGNYVNVYIDNRESTEYRIDGWVELEEKRAKKKWMKLRDSPHLQLYHNANYIVCAMVKDTTAFPNPKCESFKTYSKCISTQSIEIKKRGTGFTITWQGTTRTDFKHYRITMTRSQEICGKEKTIEETSSTPSLSVKEDVFGKWKVCVLPIKKSHDDSCNKEETCYHFEFGQLSLSVNNLLLSPKKDSIVATWSPNDIWFSECTLQSYFITWEDNQKTVFCYENWCIYNITGLEPKPYEVKIKPIFDGGIDGEPTFEVATPCPKPVSNIQQIEERSNPLFVTWQDGYNTSLSYVVRVKQLKYKLCGGRNVNDTFISDQKNIVTDWNKFVPFKICVQHHNLANSSCQNHEVCEEFSPSRKLSLSVKNLQLSPKKDSIVATWSPNEIWSSECTLQSYFITWGDDQKKVFCSEKSCSYTITDLEPKPYKVKITPFFRGGTEGEPTIKEVTPCPKPVSNIQRIETNNDLSITWDDNRYKTPLTYEVRIKQLKNKLCGGKNVDVRKTSTKKKIVLKEWNPFVPLKISIQHQSLANQFCQTVEEWKNFNPLEKVPLMIEELKAIPRDTSVVLTWRIPPEWKTLCRLRYFSVLLEQPRKEARVPPGEHCSPSSCNFTWSEPKLKEETNHTFQVFPLFKNNKKGSKKTIEVTTLPKLPDTPIEALQEFPDSIIVYDVQEHLTRNSSCEILVKEVISNLSVRFDCSNGDGIIKVQDGRQYNVNYRICNIRGCSISDLLEIWTKPTVSKNVTLLESSGNTISVSVPYFGNYSDGFIYILVAGDSGPPLGKSVAEVFVANLLQNRTRRRRSLNQFDDENERIIYHQKVPITTKKYDLEAAALDEDNQDESLYISTVCAIGKGENRKIVATDFVGPFYFYTFPVALTTVASIFFILLVGAVIGVVLLGRLRKSKQEKKFDSLYVEVETSSNTPPDLTIKLQPNNTSQLSEKVIPLEQIGDSKDLPNVVREYENIKTDLSCEENLETYLIYAAHSQSLIEKEFEAVPRLTPGMSTLKGTSAQNRKKNRYGNNIPYDETRVILPKLDEDDSSDYINANIIKIPVGVSRETATYIAAQGPMDKKNVISDFWRMIWHCGVEAVVMLTNLVEGGKAKCDQYWPEKGQEMIFQDGIIVTGKSVVEKKFFLIRTFFLSREMETKKVVQYHYTEWPDHNVPLAASPLAQMTNLVRSNHRLGPTIIHCSAGIGRTGCLLLVLKCLEEMELGRPLKIKDCLQELRNYRGKLIQNKMQYQFAHHLLWTIFYEVRTTFSPQEYLSALPKLRIDAKVDPKTVFLLSRQFEWLKSLPNDLTYFAATDLNNIPGHLNRFADIFPADIRRVEVMSLGESTEDRYLNAITVDGFNQKDAYIITEYPTAATLEKTWLMVFERQIPIWIMLNQVDENSQDYPSIIPDPNSTASFTFLMIEVLSTCRYDYYEENEIRIHTQVQENQIITFDLCFIKLFGWKYPTAIPQMGPDSLFSLLEKIDSKGASNCPLLFTCVNGVTACGITLVLDIVRRRTESLGEISILSACVDICYARPEFIVSLEQYIMLHDFMGSFLLRQEQDIYGEISPLN